MLGLLSRTGALHWFQTREAFTSGVLIQSVDALVPTLTRPMVLVLDNAAVHRGRAVRERRKGWKVTGLRLLFLPPYCPHLNKIEALWRHVKHRWLAPAACADCPSRRSAGPPR